MASSAAAKRPQILQLTPANEITLLGPFDHVVTSFLELFNPTKEWVCFKVKTTAPRRYCVRPNSGIVPPSGKIKIAIMLQPNENDSQSERNKHKFMVQTIIVDEETTNADSVWASANPEDIMDSKLRCVFQMPILSEASEATISNASSKQPISSNNSSQQQRAQTTSSQTAAGDGQNVSRSNELSAPSAAIVKNRSDTSNQYLKLPAYVDDANKSTSVHNLTSSFLQSDDYKLVLLGLAMLFIGILLGKYII